MRKFLFLLSGFFTLFNIGAQIPVTSSNGTDVWYCIKAPRGATTSAVWVTAAADNSQVLEKDFNYSDAQLWKVVTSGEGLALVNKAYGTYLNTDFLGAERLNTSVLAPLCVLQISPSTHLTNAVYVENKGAISDLPYSDTQKTNTFLMHAGGSYDNYGLVNYYDDYNDNCSFLFVPALNAGKVAFSELINVVNKTLQLSSEGNNPGQFTADDRLAMTNAIEAAKIVYDNPASTSAELGTAYTELSQIYTIFKTLIVVPKPSNGTSETWYYIQGTRPAGTYLTSTGSTGKVKDAVIVPDDTQLWKIVELGSGVALQNKATGEYINTDVSSGTEFVTQTDKPLNGIRFIQSAEITNGAYHFLIESLEGAETQLRFHAGGAGNGYNAMNWTGNKNDNCSWLFLDFSVAMQQVLQEKVNTANALLKSIIEGNGFGEYGASSASAKQALLTEITTATTMLKDESTTVDQIKIEMASLDSVLDNFKATINVNVESLLSSTPNNYRWYWIKSNATEAAANYCYNKVISQGAKNVGDKFIYEAKASSPDDAQLFRFELTEDKTKVLNIINKKGNYLAADGAIATATTEGNDFSMIALSDGLSFNIKPSIKDAIHALGGGTISNYPTAAGGASAWIIEYAMETPMVNAVKQTTTSKFRITCKNGVLLVEGVTNFELYSVLGQKVNPRSALENGVYFIKVNNYTQKIIIK